jgi:hypothetical protein
VAFLGGTQIPTENLTTSPEDEGANEVLEQDSRIDATHYTERTIFTKPKIMGGETGAVRA